MCLRWNLEIVVQTHCAAPPASCDPVTCKCLGSDVCGAATCMSVDGGVVDCALLADETSEEDEKDNPCYDGAAGANVVMGTQLPDGGFKVEVLPPP